jgi:branched-chain amino acid transport system permease protein
VNGALFYLTTLLVYAGVDMLACLGLSIQFGVAGVTNFGFIIFQAAGAYTAAILSMSSDKSNGGFQTYVGGFHLPFPIPWIGAAVIGGLLALPFTFIVGRRLRGDFAAIGLLVAAVMANLLVTNFRPLLNGSAGLSLVPAPLQGRYDPQSATYQLVYSAGAVVIAFLVYFFLRRLTESPYGRTLRAMRDNDVVADSLGKNLVSLRTSTLVLGGAIAGLSGGLLVGFINLWAPAGWGYAETVVLFAAVIIGGAGNHKGAMLGAIVVPLAFEELTRFIPAFGPPGLIPALQWVAIGLLIISFLWFRPQGLFPEPRRVSPRFANDALLGTEVHADESEGDWSLPGAGTAGRALVSDSQPTSHFEAAGETILQVRSLARSFDGAMAVNGVSFELLRGRLTGLIGPNGAGKSTTLAMLAGTLAVTSGRIIYKGDDITAIPAFRRARSGIVRTFQLASEFKRLTVLENLLCAVPQQSGDSFRGALIGKRSWVADETAATEKAAEMLERFGLTKYANTYAGDLSGGQRRLVEIMRALMTDPTLLLLDEPMAGVHPHLARQIGHELNQLCREGMTIMMVEHELAIMDEFCDPVIVMAEGTVLAQGTMAELRAKPEVVEAYLVG